MLDATTIFTIVAVFSILNLGVGFLLGKQGISGISNDISELKGLINGQSKVSVVPAAGSTTSFPAATPVVFTTNSPAA